MNARKTTSFSHALSICGLSQQDAADYLDVRLDTVKSWSADRNPTPPGAWCDLGKLYAQMHKCADEAVKLVAELTEKHGRPPEDIDINSSGERGQWPSLGCALAVEAMIRLQISSGEEK